MDIFEFDFAGASFLSGTLTVNITRFKNLYRLFSFPLYLHYRIHHHQFGFQLHPFHFPYIFCHLHQMIRMVVQRFL
jgi:hypothetical protein